MQLDTHKKLVVIITVAHGMPAAQQLLSAIPANFKGVVLYQQAMRPVGAPFIFEGLARKSALPVQWAHDNQKMHAGMVYLCPADRRFSFYERSIINLAPAKIQTAESLHSLANMYGHHVLLIALTDIPTSEADGVYHLLNKGAMVLAQQTAHNQALSNHFKAAHYKTIPPQYLCHEVLKHIDAGTATATPSNSIIISPRLREYLEYYLQLNLKHHQTAMGNITLIKPNSNLIEVVLEKGMGQHAHPSLVGVNGTLPYLHALRTRQPVIIEDTGNEVRFNKCLHNIKLFKAGQITPIYSPNGVPIGTLSSFFAAPRKFSPEELIKTSEISAGIAGAVVKFPYSAGHRLN